MTTLSKSLTGVAVAVVVSAVAQAPAQAGSWKSSSDAHLVNKMIHALSPSRGHYRQKRHGWKPKHHFKKHYKHYNHYGRRKHFKKQYRHYDHYAQKPYYNDRYWRQGFAKRYGWNSGSWVLRSHRTGHVDLQVFFKVGSAQLTRNAYHVLDSLGEALRYGSLKHSYFKIGGHTDASGSYGSNQYLSERRAHAVKRYLSRYHGIAPRRLVAVGFGEGRLAFPGHPYSKKNRRVEVSVISKAQAYRLRHRNKGHNTYARY